MPETMALPPSPSVAAVHVENKPWWRTTWCLHRAQLLAFVLAYVGLTALFVGMGKLITGPLNGAVQPTDDSVAKWFADRRTSFMNPLSTVGSGFATRSSTSSRRPSSTASSPRPVRPAPSRSATPAPS